LKIVEWLRSGYIALHPDPVLNRLTAAETQLSESCPTGARLASEAWT
jgi:hypothetical protein